MATPQSFCDTPSAGMEASRNWQHCLQAKDKQNLIRHSLSKHRVKNGKKIQKGLVV
jgi:hypothetical protein